MRDIISEALKGHNADYIDLRIEEFRASQVSFRGRDLEEIGETTELGGNARALVNGGWGFVSFNDLSDLRQKVARAVQHARLVGKGKSELAPPPTTVDTVALDPTSDLAQVTLADKKALMEEYNEEVWATGSRIQSSRAYYRDSQGTRYFANSEGAYIEQSASDIKLVVLAIARDGGNVQQALVSTGTSRGFEALKGLNEACREAARRADRLLDAPLIKAGEYPVILDQGLAGVFIHEAFGHLSEADFVYENARLRDLLVLGRTFGRPELNVYDGASIPGLRSTYRYDDEGIRAQKTYLIRGGMLVGRLHSLETAGKMQEAPTGNARALDYRFPPIVRMTNTSIEPGETPLDEMLADIKLGVYAKGSLGGETRIEMFTFSPEEAYMIRNGRIEEPVSGALLTGNVFVTLQNIDAISNDQRWNQGGGCGKGEQGPLPVSDGSPHIRISQAVVGGR